MSGSFRRAFGKWLLSETEGLTVLAAEYANVDEDYPVCYVSEIDADSSLISCGRRDFVKRDEDGVITENGKLVERKHTLRCLIQAIDTDTNAGQDVAESKRSEIETLVERRVLAPEPLVVIDDEVTPSEQWTLTGLRLAGRAAVPVEKTQKPFLYQCAVSVEARYLAALTTEVDDTIEMIYIEHAGG